MRIFICGQKEFGASALRLVRKIGHDVVGVSCPILNARGDGPDRLRDAANTFGIPASEAGGLNAATLPSGVDLIVCAHSHDFIGRATRLRSRLGAIGYHPSLLPRHRGRDAVSWAIKFSDPITGGTVYWMNEVMDGGPIAVQDWCWINPGETAEELWRRSLFDMGLRLLEKVLSDPEWYFANKQAQEQRHATFEPACNPPRAYRPDLPMIGYSEKAVCHSATPE